jgi:malate permease and related proteins
MIAVRIFEITFPIFAIVAAGLFYAKEFRPDMALPNRLNMEIFIPCLLFSVLIERGGVSGLFGGLALAIALVILLSGLVALLASHLFNFDPRSLCPPIMFSNAGNLGLPLVVLSFGEVALPAAVICFVVCNYFHITIGRYILNKQPNILKVFLSPMIVAVVLALILSLLHINVSQTLLEPIRMLGNICVPLMLFALGVRLKDMRLSEWKIGMLVALLAPLSGVSIVLIIFQFIELTRLEQGALFLFGVLPPAVMNFIFAEHYNQEPAKVAAMALVYVLPRFG